MHPDSPDPMLVFDPSPLAEISSGDFDYEREIVSEFLEQADGQIADMRRTVAAGSPAEVGRTAHTLKGSSGTLGAAALSALCAELESAARTGDLATVAPLLDRAARMVVETRERMEDHLRRHRRAG